MDFNELARLKQLFSQYSFKWLKDYLGVTKDTITTWAHKGQIPKRWKRLTIEYLENCNQDIQDFCELLAKELRN
jgi:hypothetical protein